jgi:hypothetical protein
MCDEIVVRQHKVKEVKQTVVEHDIDIADVGTQKSMGCIHGADVSPER